MRTIVTTVLIVTLAGPAPAQETRLNVFDPSVVLNTGGRTAACDAIHFSPDGKQLLAVGDDKCVHVWDVADKSLTYARPAWWNSFRERRGCMFALAVSADGKHAVAGGFGRLTSDVVVFDLETRQIRAALSAAIQPAYARAESTVWAVAFAPAGDRVAVGHGNGSVWLWDFAKPPAEAVREIAPALADEEGDFTHEARVSWVGFAPNGAVRFARRLGDVFEAGPDGPRKLWSFDGPVAQAVSTPDGARIVARSAGQRLVTRPDGSRTVASALEVRGLATGQKFGTVEFPPEEFPDGLGMDPTGKRVGVGVKVLDAPGGEKLFREAAGYLRVFDVSGPAPRVLVNASFGMNPDDPVKSFPEGVAFHPDGVRVAVAAGWDHETSLWRIDGDKLIPLDVSVGVGMAVWEVRATVDGGRISYRTGGAVHPTDPNRRAVGPWRTFDLRERQWVRGSEPQGEGAIATLDGWTVEPDPNDQFRWQVRSADGTHRYPLPLDRLRDFTPICYTFLPATPGATSVRLAVGHYWGYSLFEFAPGVPPRRIRRGTGHHGYVTSIVPAAGGKWLVTASRDETIAIWSVEPWGNQPELGAKFEDVSANEFQVTAVDAGSPGWEAGLIPGDKVRGLYRGGRRLDSLDWEEALKKPTPGEELGFELWRFAQQSAPIRRKTSVLQRPVWRFLPAGAADWVLYRYQDFAYDASSNGDSYVGWLLGGPSAADTPTFTPASRFAARFRRPAEVRDFMTRYSREPAPFFRELIPPPTVAVTTSAEAVPGAGVTITVRAAPARKPGGEAIPIDKVELWLGDESNLDCRLREWPGGADKLELTAAIRPEELRIGRNRLVAVVHSHARAESGVSVTLTPDAPRPGVLRGVVVGVNRYRQVGFSDLDASGNDARLVRAALERIGSSAPFRRAEVRVLTDEQATPAAVLATLDEAAAASAPDDWLVVFLAGHGFCLRGTPGAIDGVGEVNPGSWFFAAYAPDASAPMRVEARELFARLAKAKCRKLVLLDSCHSGAAAGADGARDLRQDGKGAIVLTAAAPDELAGEAVVTVVQGGATVRQKHGFFTTAVHEGLGPEGGRADRNGDGLLTIDELFEFARGEVARLRSDGGQTVTMSPFPVRNVGLVGVGK